jgi:GTP-binding protein
VRWRHEKNKEYSGAAGGNGGPGGDVYARAVHDINVLARYKTSKSFNATHGEAGQNFSRQGKSGEDFIIDLPLGSVIKNLNTERTVELLHEGQMEKILHGGRGGLGNEHFKASTNIRPEQSTSGQEGEEGDFIVELNLIADAGFIGLPNAGKSSLLNVLTSANAKVGSYAFTTLDPNLGIMHGYVLADIPGIIEGAASGKGLGYKFLKHVKRTNLLLHLVSLENETNNDSGDNAKSGLSKEESLKVAVDNLVKNYQVIRNELTKFGEGLSDKKEMIILTKTDLASKDFIKKVKKTLIKFNKDLVEVTILDDDSVKNLSSEIAKRLEALPKSE